jgi:hypothetical protein
MGSKIHSYRESGIISNQETDKMTPPEKHDNIDIVIDAFRPKFLVDSVHSLYRNKGSSPTNSAIRSIRDKRMNFRAFISIFSGNRRV